jgi:hypothetical protein
MLAYAHIGYQKIVYVRFCLHMLEYADIVCNMLAHASSIC